MADTISVKKTKHTKGLFAAVLGGIAGLIAIYPVASQYRTSNYNSVNSALKGDMERLGGDMRIAIKKVRHQDGR